MRQSEARDLRSFLEEPVEDIVVEGLKGHFASLQPDRRAEVGREEMRITGEWEGANAPLQDAGVKFIAPWVGTDAQLQGTGAQFTTPWEGTGGQLHEVGSRFTGPLVVDDLMLQPTMPIRQELSGEKSGQNALRPYRLQGYQSHEIPVASTEGLHLHSTDTQERWTTEDLAPAPQKVVSILPDWERRRREIYTWLVLITLFLLVILGGIGLDSLIANYR